MQRELDFILIANRTNTALAYIRKFGLTLDSVAIATNLSWYKKAKERCGAGTRIILIEDVTEHEAYFSAMHDIREAEYLNEVSDVIRDTEGNPLVYRGSSSDFNMARRNLSLCT